MSLLTSEKLSNLVFSNYIVCEYNTKQDNTSPSPNLLGAVPKISISKKYPFARSHIAISYPWLPNVPCHQHELSVVLRKYVSNSSDCIRVSEEALQLHIVY